MQFSVYSTAGTKITTEVLAFKAELKTVVAKAFAIALAGTPYVPAMPCAFTFNPDLIVSQPCPALGPP
jgi:hypothetical protein